MQDAALVGSEARRVVPQGTWLTAWFRRFAGVRAVPVGGEHVADLVLSRNEVALRLEAEELLLARRLYAELDAKTKHPPLRRWTKADARHDLTKHERYQFELAQYNYRQLDRQYEEARWPRFIFAARLRRDRAAAAKAMRQASKTLRKRDFDLRFTREGRAEVEAAKRQRAEAVAQDASLRRQKADALQDVHKMERKILSRARVVENTRRATLKGSTEPEKWNAFANLVTAAMRGRPLPEAATPPAPSQGAAAVAAAAGAPAKAQEAQELRPLEGPNMIDLRGLFSAKFAQQMGASGEEAAVQEVPAQTGPSPHRQEQTAAPQRPGGLVLDEPPPPPRRPGGPAAAVQRPMRSAAAGDAVPPPPTRILARAGTGPLGPRRPARVVPAQESSNIPARPGRYGGGSR